MPQSQEIELKFICAPEDLGRVMAAAPAGDDEARELISVYFDTPDLALQRAGASLRVRESKGQRVQTLKRGDGLAREEHETPISGAAPDPSLLPDLLPQGSACELKPAFNVRVNRRQRLVRYDGAEIELALDQGEVRGGKRVQAISEVELELKSGEPAALFGLARELGRAAPLYLSFESKSSRGQALVAGEPAKARKRQKVELDRDATVGGAFQAIARGCLTQITGNSEILRERADAEAVHQLRVAARTLRSALSTFRAVVEDKDFETVKAELRWIAKACDMARNLDVFVAETLKPAVAWSPRPANLDALAAALEVECETAHRAVAEAAASDRFRTALVDLTAWVETGDWLRAEPARQPAVRFAERALQKRCRKLLKDGRGLADLTDEARHKIRINAKKLRYAAEGFQSLFPKKTALRFIDRLKALQEELGALNDIVTAETLMLGLPLGAQAAFAAGELVGRKAGQKQAHVKAAAEALDRLAEVEPFWD